MWLNVIISGLCSYKWLSVVTILVYVVSPRLTWLEVAKVVLCCDFMCFCG